MKIKNINPWIVIIGIITIAIIISRLPIARETGIVGKQIFEFQFGRQGYCTDPGVTPVYEMELDNQGVCTGRLITVCEVNFKCSGSNCFSTYEAANAACIATLPCNTNSVCDAGESNTNCPSDCPIVIECNSNGACEPGESRVTCHDCIVEPVCDNDGYCDSTSGENGNNCLDCVSVCPTTAKSISLSDLRSLSPASYGDYICGDINSLFLACNIGCPTNSTCTLGNGLSLAKAEEKAVYEYKKAVATEAKVHGFLGIIESISVWLAGTTPEAFAEARGTGGICLEKAKGFCEYVSGLNIFGMSNACTGGAVVAVIGLLLLMFVLNMFMNPKKR